MTAEEVMRHMLVALAVGYAVRKEPGFHIENIRSNPDVPEFAAATVCYDSGQKIRINVNLQT
jgi:hypothetical protein